MFGRLRSSTIAKAISSNLYIQIVQTIAQFLLVPVLASHWGLKVYGTWLLLSTVPSYLAMADLGLGSAAANDMAAHMARGERDIAAATYNAVRLTVLLVVVAMLGAGAVVLYVLFPHLLDGSQAILGGQARAVMMAMIAYGGIALTNNVISAGYRCIGGYAVSGYIGGTLLLTEVVLVVVVVVNGGGIAAAATAYLGIRLIGTMIFGVDLARRAPWLVRWDVKPSWRLVRRLLRPAVAVMAVPVAQAFSIQGTVAMIGFVGGAAAIPAFTAVRTLSRVVIQAILIVNHAIMPSFTTASAVSDQGSTRRFAMMSMATSFGFGIPGMLALMIGGQFFVIHWTGGKIHPDFVLIAIMAITTFLAALWLPVSNLILSINRHESFTYYYLGVTLFALALSYPLIGWLGSTGAALALLAIDAVMIRHVFRMASRIGILDWREIPASMAALLDRLRSRLGHRPN